MNTDLTITNPDLEGFDLAGMAGLGAWHDGSGGGINQLAWEMGKIRETEDRINLLRAFIRKHQMLLARLSWSVDINSLPPVKTEGVLFVPQIELSPSTYNKKASTPREIASLWPDAVWSRSLPAYSHEEDRRDYTAEVDGVTLRIKNAEVAKPIKVSAFKRCGPIGRFE